LDDVWFAEDSLERVGPFPTPEEWRESSWRDNVDLRLVTTVIYDDPGENEQGETPETEEDRQAEWIAESAKAVLEDLFDPPEVERIVYSYYCASGEPIEILFTVETVDDVGAYQRIVSAPPRAWLHGEGSQGFPMSSWERPEGEDMHFLAPGIQSAKVTCEHWSTPQRFVALGGPLGADVGEEDRLTAENLALAMEESFPDLASDLQKVADEWDPLPPLYMEVGAILTPQVVNAAHADDDARLHDLGVFMERMANSSDRRIRDALTHAFAFIGDDRPALERARKAMGPETLALSIQIETHWGREPG
jgi:hypothetical protein